MADREMGFSVTMAVVVVLVLAALAAAAWQLGLFRQGSEQDEQTAYKVGVTDESGGELIVTDPDAPGIEDLELPKTPMTPVPPSEQPSPTASPRRGAE
jgi:hypothetical protein